MDFTEIKKNQSKKIRFHIINLKRIKNLIKTMGNCKMNCQARTGMLEQFNANIENSPKEKILSKILKLRYQLISYINIQHQIKTTQENLRLSESNLQQQYCSEQILDAIHLVQKIIPENSVILDGIVTEYQNNNQKESILLTNIQHFIYESAQFQKITNQIKNKDKQSDFQNISHLKMVNQILKVSFFQTKQLQSQNQMYSSLSENNKSLKTFILKHKNQINKAISLLNPLSLSKMNPLISKAFAYQLQNRVKFQIKEKEYLWKVFKVDHQYRNMYQINNRIVLNSFLSISQKGSNQSQKYMAPFHNKWTICVNILKNNNLQLFQFQQELIQQQKHKYMILPYNCFKIVSVEIDQKNKYKSIILQPEKCLIQTLRSNYKVKQQTHSKPHIDMKSDYAKIIGNHKQMIKQRIHILQQNFKSSYLSDSHIRRQVQMINFINDLQHVQKHLLKNHSQMIVKAEEFHSELFQHSTIYKQENQSTKPQCKFKSRPVTKDFVDYFQTTISTNQQDIVDLEELQIRCKSMIKLNLSNNKISQIVYIQFFDNLKQLYLQNNFIKEIKNLESVPLLQKLNLNYNFIFHLDNIHHMSKLKSLQISQNLIGVSSAQYLLHSAEHQAFLYLQQLYISFHEKKAKLNEECYRKILSENNLFPRLRILEIQNIDQLNDDCVAWISGVAKMRDLTFRWWYM